MYTARVYRGVFITSDIQYIIIPAAHRARSALCRRSNEPNRRQSVDRFNKIAP
jgi:hypothetical protein